MCLLVGVGIATDAQVDLELGELALQLRDQPVEAIAGAGVEVRVQRHDLEGGRVDAGEAVDQVGTERQGRTKVVNLELARACVQMRVTRLYVYSFKDYEKCGLLFGRDSY